MKIGGIDIVVRKGDITETDCRAVVNAANNEFRMGGGVAKAIKKKGGEQIEDEVVKQGPVNIGDSVISGAGKLKADFVIHSATMGLDFKTNGEYIRKAVKTALRAAQEKKIDSVAFPALGCGTGGFSFKNSAKIMAQEVFTYCKEIDNPEVKTIEFVLFTEKGYADFQKYVYKYLDHLENKISKGPFLTVDGIVEFKGGVVLVQRKNPPLGWAIPGGFVDYGESVEESVRREVKEETNLDFIDFKQFHTYSDPARDPRFHTVSVVFGGKGEGELKAASDARDAKAFKWDELPADFAFDHRSVLEAYKKKLEVRD